ncbi:MAG: hypothetical protein AB7S49_12945 [Arcobacter sp.]|uniref:hypothetical protein n=1 Tax=Arcobacter sp. TaxID=1872629 RepID=UPI003D0470A9
MYMLVSSYILFKIGFGFFSSTNRFDNARGFGHFIRLLDLLQPFILSFTTLMLMNRKSLISKIIFVFFILIFVFYSAFINGAKISVIFSILTIVFTICLFYNPKKFRVNVFTIILLFFIGFVFATAALKMNLIMNNENIDKKSELINGIPIVLEKLILRIVANGNTSYLLLPNDIIEKIETDSVISRFLSSIIGISLSSKIMGYDTSSYSVGRQANLYYDPKVEIAGGPTSHLDLFAYVYFGPFFGCFFIIITAFTLGHIYSAIINYRKKNFLSIAFLSTLWVRSVIVIVEPTIGYAYIIDVFIFFTILYILVNLLMISKKVIYYE